MNEKMLAYTLEQSEIGVRMMARDKQNVHVFNYGVASDGQTYVFVQAILTELELQPISKVLNWPALEDSPPLEATA